jgi:hypothetical protein
MLYTQPQLKSIITTLTLSAVPRRKLSSSRASAVCFAAVSPLSPLAAWWEACADGQEGFEENTGANSGKVGVQNRNNRGAPIAAQSRMGKATTYARCVDGSCRQLVTHRAHLQRALGTLNRVTVAEHVPQAVAAKDDKMVARA